MQLKRDPISDSGSALFRLPREIRDTIYAFAIPKRDWMIGNHADFTEMDFARSIGDPSGFLFPLRKDLTILRVNMQMRQEALPLAYRRTAFHCLDDMESFIRLAISIGEIGRRNIESLMFNWDSLSDLDHRFAQLPMDDVVKLPFLHVPRCIKLLKQCRRLKSLVLVFNDNIVSKTSLEDLKADPGVRELCSVQGLDRVHLWDGRGSPKFHDWAEWLKERMESSKEDEDQSVGEGRGRQK